MSTSGFQSWETCATPCGVSEYAFRCRSPIGSVYAIVLPPPPVNENVFAFIFVRMTIGYSMPFVAWIVRTVTVSVPARVSTSWVLPSAIAVSMNRMSSPRVNVVVRCSDPPTERRV